LHPDYRSCLNLIGITFDKIGDFSQALEYKYQLKQIITKIYAISHPEYAYS